jgi:hypothetical protein
MEGEAMPDPRPAAFVVIGHQYRPADPDLPAAGKVHVVTVETDLGQTVTVELAPGAFNKAGLVKAVQDRLAAVADSWLWDKHAL